MNPQELLDKINSLKCGSDLQFLGEQFSEDYKLGYDDALEDIHKFIEENSYN